MTIDEYQQAALRTASKSLNWSGTLLNAALGLCGESGEFADIVKKRFYQNHEDIDFENHLVKELGDIALYLALAASALGVPLSEVLEMNIDKLKSRYPKGFESERSLHRAEGDI